MVGLRIELALWYHALAAFAISHAGLSLVFVFFNVAKHETRTWTPSGRPDSLTPCPQLKQ